jgi:small subunit ribosomal protein S11
VAKKAKKKAAKQKQQHKPKAKTKKKTRSSPIGIAHVKATFNNTIITIADLSGNVVAWGSAGKAKFTGSRKSSAFAAMLAAQNAGKEAAALGMKECEVNLTGPGAGRESAVRGLSSAGLTVTLIRDTTPIPHNGCRPRKRRRV